MVNIKGAIPLSLTITSFLLVVSYSQISDNTRSVYVPLFLVLATVSLASLIFVERKSDNPIISLKLMTDK
jgi:hypothetical protein